MFYIRNEEFEYVSITETDDIELIDDKMFSTPFENEEDAKEFIVELEKIFSSKFKIEKV